MTFIFLTKREKACHAVLVTYAAHCKLKRVQHLHYDYTQEERKETQEI